MILDEVDGASREILERNGFDPAAFEALRAALAAGALTTASNVLGGTVEPPQPGELTAVPEPGTDGWEDAVAAGAAALRAGEIAVVVLAGGMATRFGGGVKAVAEALDGRSFLEVKLGETRRCEADLGATVPVVLMTSFATDEAVRAHVEERRLGDTLRFRQTAAPRLRPDGSVFREVDGRASLYGPGHGDLLGCLRASGVLDELTGRGVRTVMVSNVDNLAARVEPAIAGMHLLADRPLTVEVVEKGDDTGGAPARVDGRLQLVEAFRFPASFDQSSIPVFNTNTSWIDLDALRDPVELTWLVVEKGVNGETAIQFERLYHELSAHVPTTYLVVPRRGPRCRFLPVKEPSDLAAAGPLLRALLGSG